MEFQKKKSFGQHFLHEKAVIKKIVHSLIPAHTIVEIGPGGGALTDEIMKLSFSKVILAEADISLFEEIEAKYAKATLMKGDAAKADFTQEVEGDWVCVGNLPYNAAAPIMSHVLQQNPSPRQCLFMIQKEQAERVCAQRGEMSMLSLAVQLYGKPTRLFNVAPGCFAPPPKVESSVIEIIPYPNVDKAENEQILQFAKRAFQHRRKQLRKTLGEDPEQRRKVEKSLDEMGLPEDCRPQMLGAEEWQYLYRELK